MRETIVRLTPRLRRYAHALLGSWPAIGRTDDGRPRPDQEADDLAHEALLDFWRASGFAGRQRGMNSDLAAPIAFGPMRNENLLLYRRITELASKRLAEKQGDVPQPKVGSLATPIPDNERGRDRASHFAWAPESRALPRLPFQSRALLALVALEGLSYAQAGEVLDIPEEQALARLAVARVRLAAEISGRRRQHLTALTPPAAEEAVLLGGPVTEADLHGFVDDLLGAARREEVESWLEKHPETTQRVGEWRRHSERLRLAFDLLARAPLPLSLNFSAPAPRQAFREHRPSRNFRARNLLSGLATLWANSTGSRLLPR